MNNQNKQVNKDIRFSGTSVFIILILIGVSLIMISITIEHHFWKEFFKELGIVFSAVSGVSLIYELWIAEKHFKKFHSELKQQIESGESNAAICARLGILEIFPTRDSFEIRYPFVDILSSIPAKAPIRILGRSLFLVMNKPASLKKAVQQGATLQFSCCDPDTISEEIIRVSEVEPSDVRSAISTFQKQFIKWLEIEKPMGEIEIRFHAFHLLDSFFEFTFKNKKLAAWDLSFGRDTSDKRVFLLDGSYDFYNSLQRRYENIWNQSKVVFWYTNQKIEINNMDNKA